MSVGFSTIRPLDPSTISKAPAFAVNNQQSQQPSASSPMEAGEAPKKKSHWFAKTLTTVVVLAAAVGLGRKYMPKTFNPEAVLKDGAKWYEQGLHYATKGIGQAGEFINSNIAKGWNYVANKFKGSGAGGETPIETVAETVVETAAK